MTVRRMRISHWIPKATNTHSRNMWYILLFHDTNCCTNTSQWYVIATLPALRNKRSVMFYFTKFHSAFRKRTTRFSDVSMKIVI
jgi:hypothetical protein